MIIFTLSEAETGDIIWTDQIGIAQLIDQETIRIKINSIPVRKETACRLTIAGLFSERFPDGQVYPYETQTGEIVFSLR